MNMTLYTFGPIAVPPAAFQAAADLIAEWEGFRPYAYRDGGGVWTIGYGTTSAASVGITPAQGRWVSEPDARVYLRRAILKFAHQIVPHIKRQPTEDQFVAMLSLAYNIGPSAFRRSSVLRKFNAGDLLGSADAFLLWRKDNGRVVRGLVNRRNAERLVFLGQAPKAP